MISQQKFPKDFLWGASTASHQVEGGTVNQWSEWELGHAADLAATAEQRYAKSSPIVKSPDWTDIKPLATDPENYVSGRGVDHYNRYEEDFDLVEKLNFNAFRFGIEWSRIEPEEGAWNLEAIKHYHDYIDSLHRRGITPVLNIWHWTMPTWFTNKGGFEKKENLPLFAAFVAKVAEEYGDKVKYYITINEPNNYASLSYYAAIWPPQKKSLPLMVKVYRNLAKAHNQAYDLIKAANPAAQVGVAAHLTNIQPKRLNNYLDVTAVKVSAYFWNWWFLNRIRRRQDFVGINYYRTEYYKTFGGNTTPMGPNNDMGWYMEPEGIYRVITAAWQRYRKPIIIAENGVADRKDQYRQWWIGQTVIAMQRAMSEGVDLRGYMHWSLLDNFEWADGWWPKFGLVEVDRANAMKRTPRPSALWFAERLAEIRGLKRQTSASEARTAKPEASAHAAEQPARGKSAEAPRPQAKPVRTVAAPTPAPAPASRKQMRVAPTQLRAQARAAGRKMTDIGGKMRMVPRQAAPGQGGKASPAQPGTSQPGQEPQGARRTSAGGHRLDLSRLRKRIQ